MPDYFPGIIYKRTEWKPAVPDIVYQPELNAAPEPDIDQPDLHTVSAAGNIDHAELNPGQVFGIICDAALHAENILGNIGEHRQLKSVNIVGHVDRARLEAVKTASKIDQTGLKPVELFIIYAIWNCSLNPVQFFAGTANAGSLDAADVFCGGNEP